MPTLDSKIADKISQESFSPRETRNSLQMNSESLSKSQGATAVSALQTMLKSLNDRDWHVVKAVEDQGANNFTVSKKTGESGTICIKAEALLEGTPEQVFHHMMSDESDLNWLAKTSAKTVEVLSPPAFSYEGHEVLAFKDFRIMHASLQPYIPISERDWCVMRSCVAKPEEGTYIICAHSVEHPDCPEKKNFIRGHLYPSGFVIRQMMGKCTITAMFCVDLRGWLPAVMKVFLWSEYFVIQTGQIIVQGLRKSLEGPSDREHDEQSNKQFEQAFFDIIKAGNSEDSSGWMQIQNEEEFQVSAKLHGSVCSTRATIMVDETPARIFNTLVDTSRWKDWMVGFAEGKVVSTIINSEEGRCTPTIGHLHFDKSVDKIVHLAVANVDFSLLESSMLSTENKTAVLLFRSVSHSSVPENEHYKRCNLPLSGFMISPANDKKSIITCVAQLDLHQIIPNEEQHNPLMKQVSFVTFVAAMRCLKNLFNEDLDHKASLTAMDAEQFDLNLGSSLQGESAVSPNTVKDYANMFSLEDISSLFEGTKSPLGLAPKSGANETVDTIALPSSEPSATNFMESFNVPKDQAPPAAQQPPVSELLSGNFPFDMLTPSPNPKRGLATTKESAGGDEKRQRVASFVQNPNPLAPQVQEALNSIAANTPSLSTYLMNTAQNAGLFGQHVSPNFTGMQPPPAGQRPEVIKTERLSYGYMRPPKDKRDKRPTFRRYQKGRLIWTRGLHQAFLDAVAELGIENAKPQAILKRMNIEGLTTDHIKSHLQKYRQSFRDNVECEDVDYQILDSPSPSPTFKEPSGLPVGIVASNGLMLSVKSDQIPHGTLDALDSHSRSISSTNMPLNHMSAPPPAHMHMQHPNPPAPNFFHQPELHNPPTILHTNPPASAAMVEAMPALAPAPAPVPPSTSDSTIAAATSLLTQTAAATKDLENMITTQCATAMQQPSQRGGGSAVPVDQMLQSVGDIATRVEGLLGALTSFASILKAAKPPQGQ